MWCCRRKKKCLLLFTIILIFSLSQLSRRAPAHSPHKIKFVNERTKKYEKHENVDFPNKDSISPMLHETTGPSAEPNIDRFTDLLSDLNQYQPDKTLDMSRVMQVVKSDVIQPVKPSIIKQPKVDTSWLLSNKNIVVYSPVTMDSLPDYFDLSASDLIPQYEEFHERTAGVMEERKKLLQKGCEQVKKYVKHPQNFVFWFKELKMAWCPVFKAASTTWKQFFCKIYLPELYAEYRVKTDQDPYCPLGEMLDFSLRKQIINQKEKEKQKDKQDGNVIAEFKEGINTSLNFITVRHPYERLVSMYRNKFENCRALMFSDPDGMMVKIMKMYRVGDLTLSIEQRAAQLEAARLECRKPIPRRVIDKDNPYMNPMGATFKEVLSFIIRNFQSGIWPDFHWIPVTKSCDVCMRNYEVVEKFENLERDHYFLLKSVGEEERYRDIVGFQGNPSGPTNGRSPQELVYQYFATLDEQIIWDIYGIYKDDFALFGYIPHFRVRSNPSTRT